MKRLMLAIGLPLISVIAVAIIAIPIGIIFIQVDEATSPDGALVVAVVLTALIMAGATMASIASSKKPMLEATAPAPRTAKTAKSDPVGARIPNTAAPRRGSRRARDRK